jgi:hypothetical protein
MIAVVMEAFQDLADKPIVIVSIDQIFDAVENDLLSQEYLGASGIRSISESDERVPRDACRVLTRTIANTGSIRVFMALKSSTRASDPGGRPEHYLQGHPLGALTAPQKEILPPGTRPSTKGRRRPCHGLWDQSRSSHHLLVTLDSFAALGC